MKNITLSIDEELLQAGREYARKHRLSFNALVRKLFKQTVNSNKNNWLDETFALMDRLEITSEAIPPWNRDDLYRG